VPPGAAWDEGSELAAGLKGEEPAMTHLARMVQALRAGHWERPALRPGGQAGAAGPERS